MKEKYLLIALVIGTLASALLLIFVIYPAIYPEGGGCKLHWEGEGTGSSDTIDYDQLRSSLNARFGDRLIEVGYSYSSYRSGALGKEWLVAFGDDSLTWDDVELIRNLFPSSVTVEIWTGVKNCTILDLKPPIIQINR